MEKTIQQEVNGAYGAVQYAWAEVPTEMATTRLEGVTMFQKFGEDIDPDGVFNGSPSLLGTSAQQTAFSGNRTYAAFAMDELGCMSGEGFSFEKPKPAAIAPPGWGLYGNDASGAAPPPAPAQGGGGRWIGTNDSTDFVMKVNGEPQLKLGADGVTEFIGNVKMAQLDAVTPCGPDDDALFRLAVDPGGYLKSIAPCPPPPACIEPVNPWSVPPDGSLENVAICDDFNNVGIGYVNPTHKLHVDGTGYFKKEVGLGEPSDDNIRLLVNNMTANQTGIHVHGREINPALTITAYDDAPYFTVMGNGQVKIVGNTAGQTIPSSAIIPMLDISDTDGEAALRVFNDGKVVVGQGSGNVGIGLSDPNYKLDVCGTIRSQEWIVELTGCDFVFGEDHDLIPFEERIQEIKTSKRLPYMTSAVEMQENGASMGESFLGLLQNTEELYLYLSQLNERLSALESENVKLKGQMELMQK